MRERERARERGRGREEIMFVCDFRSERKSKVDGCDSRLVTRSNLDMLPRPFDVCVCVCCSRASAHNENHAGQSVRQREGERGGQEKRLQRQIEKRIQIQIRHVTGNVYAICKAAAHSVIPPPCFYPALLRLEHLELWPFSG